MPKKKGKSHKGRQMHGDGFFSDVWKGIKKVGGFLKDNKVISNVASLIPHAGAQNVGKVAGVLGFGRKRKSSKAHLVGRGETILPGSINAHRQAHNRVLKL